MEFADQLAGYVESEHPEFLVNKLYYDAYKKDMTAGTYPDVSTIGEMTAPGVNARITGESAGIVYKICGATRL